MKPKPAFAAATLLALLLAAPLLASAATVLVATDKPTYRAGETILITGTVSPAPGPGTSAFIQVKNPNGVVVDAAVVPVDGATGAFSHSTVAGGTAQWIAGTYTVTASWAASPGATPDVGSTTFQFLVEAPPTGTANELLTVQVLAPPFAYPGQTVQIFITTTFNGELRNATSIGAHVWQPDTARVDLPAPTLFATGHYITTYTVPSKPGTHWVHARANVSGVVNFGSAAILVLEPLATQKSIDTLSAKLDNATKLLSDKLDDVQQALSTAIDDVSKKVDALSTKLDDVQKALTAAIGDLGRTLTAKIDDVQKALSASIGDVSKKVDDARAALARSIDGVSSAVAGVSSKLDTVQSNLRGAIDALSGKVDTATAQIGQVNSFVLTVAVLVIITLVIEIVILLRIRK